MRRRWREVAHKPLDKAELEEGLRAEALDLPEKLRRFFARVAVEVYQATCTELPGQSVFVVAKSGSKAIFYDDVEEDFGIGILDGHMSLRDCRLHGELRFALVELQDD